MKEILVGGGIVDFATLHPLGTLLVLGVAALVLLGARRRLSAGRRERPGRPSGAL